MSTRLSSPKSILVVIQRPDWGDPDCHWGQHWMKEYVTKPAQEAGFEVIDLYADDAIRSKVLEACKSPNFTYFSGMGHGSATTFTGQRRGRIFWTGDEETKAVSNGHHFNFLSCVFGRAGAKWMQEEGGAIGVHGYDQSFIFVMDRRSFPNEYATPFFDSHATVDRELFKGATHGEAHQACLDRFEYWIENAPEVCQRYLAWDKEHKVFWGDPEAKILPRLRVTSEGCCPITVDGLGTVASGATEEFAVACGAEVTLTADESDPCCKFDGWEVDGNPVGGNPIKVVMDSDHTAVATCSELGPYTLAVTSDGCCPITVDGLGAVAPGGTEEFVVACGAEVTLTADESDPCCQLDGWEVDGSPVGGNPIKAIMDSDHTAVAACSEPGPYTLTVTSDGCCPITVDGLGTVAPGATEEFVVACGAEVTLTADESDPCCKFDGWEVDGSPVGGNPIKAIMDSDHTAVAACSEPGPYTLTVTSDGCCPITVDGLGTVEPSATEEFVVACGAEVTLTADESDPCCQLDGWEVDGSPVGGNPIKAIMDSDHTVVATCSESGRAPSLWEIIIRWIRKLLRFFGFPGVEKKRTSYSLAMKEAGKTSEDIEERLSRVEATLQEIKSSMDLTNKRSDDLRRDLSDIRSDIGDLRGRLGWIIGILLSMWVTIILTILFRR